MLYMLLRYAFFFISIFIDEKDTPETAVIDNHGRDQLRNPKRGLVANLTAVFNPPSEKMLARPWQQTGNNIRSETASNPPNPGAALGGLEPADGSSFGRSRSTNGRALNRLSNELSVTSVNGAIKGSHAIVNHHQKSAEVPSRRFSEPFKRFTSASSIMVEDTRVKADNALPADMVDNKSKVHANKMSWKNGMIGLRENYEDEELQYGPGIVNKLKSRYLSRTLREKPLGESRRPSLRRATSLEDWLDKDISPTPPHRLPTPIVDGDVSPVQIRSNSGKSDRRPVSLNIALSAVADSKPAPPPPTSSTNIRDLKKRSSVENFSPSTWKSVSSSDLPMPSSVQSQKPSTRNSTSPVSPNKIPVHLLLSKDAIVIVEKEDALSLAKTDASTVESKKNASAAVSSTPLPTPSSSTNFKTRRALSTNSRYNVEDAELPAPDTVRQVKRIFENGTTRKQSTRRSQSAGPGLNRVPLSAANQSIEKYNVQRMNQVNLTNVKSNTVVARKQSDTTSPKINDFPLDTKPVIITKPAPIGPKPVVMSPKPTNIPPPPSSISGTRVLSNHQAKSKVSAQSPKTAPPASKTRLPATTSSPTPVPPSIASAVKIEFSESEDDVGSQLDDTDLKTISKVALDNIRSESTTIQFNFNDKKEKKTQVPLLPSQSKQVGVIRPQLKPVSAEKQPAENNILPKTPAVTSQLGAQLLEDQKSKSTESTFDRSLPKIQAPAIAASPILAQEVLLVVPPVSTAKFQDSTPFAPITTLSKASSSSSTTKDSSSSAIHSVVHPTNVKKDTPVTAVTVKVLPPTSQIIKVIPETLANANGNATSNNAAIAKSTPSSSGVPREQKKPWHQQPETTTVFNFVNENKKIDHIRNEGGSSGILLYKVIKNLFFKIFLTGKLKN